MSFDQVIEKVRQRGFMWLQNTPLWQKGIIYDAINDALRDLALARDIEITPASLSIVANTKDYTISSAVGSDVHEIVQIDIDSGTITPKSIWAFQEEIHSSVINETSATTGTPQYFRVWNGVLRLFPTPSSTETATVYYVKKVPQAFYSTANGAATVPVGDEYINPLMDKSLGILAEQKGMFREADRYKLNAKIDLDNVLASRPQYSSDSIKYQDIVDGDAGTVRVITQD